MQTIHPKIRTVPTGINKIKAPQTLVQPTLQRSTTPPVGLFRHKSRSILGVETPMDRATVKGHASSSRSFLPGTRQPEVAHPTDVQIPLVPMRTVKSGLKGLRTLEKVALARNAVKGISGNAAFPTATPAMAVVTGAADKLETAYNNTLIGGPADLIAPRGRVGAG